MNKKLLNDKVEIKPEIKSDVVMKEELTKIKGAFDAIPGGTKLKSISEADKDANSRSIDSLILQRDRLQQEYLELPKPQGDPKIKRKRYYVNKKIKDIEKKIDGIRKAVTNKEPIQNEDLEKFENLAKMIDYKHTPLGLMDRVQFEIEKKNIFDKADKVYKNHAKVISDYIIMMSHVTDGYQSVAGYSLDLEKGKDRLELQVKKALIHEGMKGNQLADSFSNPYIGLGMALAFPLIERNQFNKHRSAEIMGKKKIPNSSGKIHGHGGDPIKVEMVNEPIKKANDVGATHLQPVITL